MSPWLGWIGTTLCVFGRVNPVATLSNCGKVLKLCLPNRRGNTGGGRGNDLG